MNDQPQVICGARAHACVCALPPGHPEDEPHACGNDQGKWLGDPDTESFEVISYPYPNGQPNGGQSVGSAIAAMLGIGFGDDE